MWSVVKLAARAAIWRSTPDPRLTGLSALLFWTAALMAVRVALQLLEAGGVARFNPYGLNAVVAVLAIELAVAALFIRPAGRTTALAAMFALSILATIVATGFRLAEGLLGSVNWAHSIAWANAIWNSAAAGYAFYALEIVWWIGAMTAVIRSLEGSPRLWAVGRVAALWLALFAVNAVVPHAPVFVGRDFNIRNANWWEYFHARSLAAHQPPGPKVPREFAQAVQSQAALLQSEIAHLAPPSKDTVNIYAIGMAGWSSLAVFGKELDGGLAALANVLPIKDRTVRLINRPDTLTTAPFADRRNFSAAVHALAGIMDKGRDVLILLMTSHGDRNGFGLELANRSFSALTPQEVASALDGEGIKNRVVIVSACYSGLFVPPLANDTTIVMTAADANSTSFGCAPERDWTYFGDALFRQSLQPGTDFQNAFEHARILIRGWEVMDRLSPSNPQAHFGPALVAKLAPFFAMPPTGRQ